MPASSSPSNPGAPPRKTNPISPAGYAALKARYDHLLGTERPAIAEIVNWVAGNVVAEFVGLAVRHTAVDTAASHPRGEAGGTAASPESRQIKNIKMKIRGIN